MLAGAVVNALAFTGSNNLFTMLSNSESENRNKALAQLQIDKEKWTEQRAQLADLASQELQRQGHALQSFKYADDALEAYRLIKMKILRRLC